MRRARLTRLTPGAVDLIGGDRVDGLVSDIDRALAAYDAQDGGAYRPELDGWYEQFTRDEMSDRERKRFRGAIITVSRRRRCST